jgi:hypothetical protein
MSNVAEVAVAEVVEMPDSNQPRPASDTEYGRG